MTPENGDLCVQKHTENSHLADNSVIALIDKNGCCVWNNKDPMNASGRLGNPVLDSVPPEDRAKVREALGHCLLEQQVVQYTVRGHYLGGELVTWRVTLLPIPMRSEGTVACCAISYVVPDNYLLFTDEDREVLRCLARDMTLRDVAEQMHRSPTAVDNKIKTLKERLNVHNIGGLVAAAIIQHII